MLTCQSQDDRELVILKKWEYYLSINYRVVQKCEQVNLSFSENTGIFTFVNSCPYVRISIKAKFNKKLLTSDLVRPLSWTCLKIESFKENIPVFIEASINVCEIKTTESLPISDFITAQYFIGKHKWSIAPPCWWWRWFYVVVRLLVFTWLVLIIENTIIYWKKKYV